MNRVHALFACSLTALLATPLLAAWDDGVAAFRAGRYEDAAAVFQSYVSSSPQAPEGHYMLGLSLLHQKRVVDALGPLDEALTRGEGAVRYRLALSQALLQAGKPVAALDKLAAQDPSLVADSERVGFNQLLAKAASSSGRDDSAFDCLEKALAADRSSKVLWLARANLAGRLDRAEDAYSALVTAFEIDPSDPEPGRGAAHAALAIAQSAPDEGRRLERYGKSAEVSDRVAGAFPTPEHRRLAGSANMGARQYEKAIGYFDEVLAANSRDPMLHYDLGRCHQALGRSQEALTHLAAALEQAPDEQLTAAVQRVRAKALRAQEDFAGAARAYRLAGAAEDAAAMEHFVQNRLEWDQAKADCAEKQTRLEQLLADSGDIQHTREYKEVQQDLATIKAACEPYFNEQG